MSYAVDNALFQWEEGERRLRETPDPANSQLERALLAVIEELRKRLGSSFTVDELADLYAADTDWASEVAQTWAAGTDSPWVVDAAFGRYAREATNYAGGRPRDLPERDEPQPRRGG
jgi:hypothetical protein